MSIIRTGDDDMAENTLRIKLHSVFSEAFGSTPADVTTHELKDGIAFGLKRLNDYGHIPQQAVQWSLQQSMPPEKFALVRDRGIERNNGQSDFEFAFQGTMSDFTASVDWKIFPRLLQERVRLLVDQLEVPLKEPQLPHLTKAIKTFLRHPIRGGRAEPESPSGGGRGR